MTARRFPLTVIPLALLAGPLGAQIVRGQVVDSVSRAPLAAAIVTLLHASETPVTETRADEEGLFLVRAPEAGEYHLRVSRDEYRSSTFPPFTLGPDEVKAFMLLVAPLEPPALRGDEVIAELCPEGTVGPGEGVLAGFVYDETLNPVADAYVAGSWHALTGALAELTRDVDADRIRNAWFTDSAGTYAVCGISVETKVLFHARAGVRSSDFYTLRFGDGGAYVDGTYHALDQPLVRHDFRVLSQAQRTAAVNGRILDGHMKPIGGAVVALADAGLETTTDTSGTFSLSGLPAGTVQLTVRQAGFRPISREIRLTRGDTVTVAPGTFILEPLPTELAPVVVEGERPDTRRPLAEFWQRRERGSGIGDYLTREEWEKQGDPQVPTEVLRRMRGIRIVPRPGSGGIGRWLVLTTRGQSRTIPGTSALGHTGCYPLYYLDGYYIGDSDQVLIDEILPIVDLEAIEVYTSIAGLPQQFNRPGAACGVILFWTR